MISVKLCSYACVKVVFSQAGVLLFARVNLTDVPSGVFDHEGM